MPLSHDAAVRRASDCQASFGGETAFLLMRDPLHRIAKTGDSFRRRGLRHPRVVPTRVGDFTVKLVFANDPRGRKRAGRGTPLSSGAGLFENLEFKMENVDGGFIVSDAIVPSQLEIIRKQIAAASADDCIGVVCPELTISKATALEIEQSIASGA